VSEPPIARFELRLKTDATISIHDTTGEVKHWIKPGSEVATTWAGWPSEAEIVERYRGLQQVMAATLEAQIALTNEELTKAEVRRAHAKR
jgi:hypothetical protein